MTNNEVRQNILAAIEQSKAWMLYHSTVAICECPQGDKRDHLDATRAHVQSIAEMVDEYQSIPANDLEWKE